MKLNNHVKIRSFLLGLTSPASHSSATHTPTHTQTLPQTLKYKKKGLREIVEVSLYMISTTSEFFDIYMKLENQFNYTGKGCFSNVTLCLAATLTGNPDTLPTWLISSPACFEVLVLVMWLTQGGETNVWPQHDQKVLWSPSEPLTIPAMPSHKLPSSIHFITSFQCASTYTT